MIRKFNEKIKDLPIAKRVYYKKILYEKIKSNTDKKLVELFDKLTNKAESKARESILPEMNRMAEEISESQVKNISEYTEQAIVEIKEEKDPFPQYSNDQRLNEKLSVNLEIEKTLHEEAQREIEAIEKRIDEQLLRITNELNLLLKGEFVNGEFVENRILRVKKILQDFIDSYSEENDLLDKRIEDLAEKLKDYAKKEDIPQKLSNYAKKKDIPKDIDIKGGDNIIIVKKEFKNKTTYTIHEENIKKEIIAIGSGIGALKNDLDNGYLDSRYVNTTGDTMSGDLDIKGNLIVDDLNGVYWGSVSGSNIYADDEGTGEKLFIYSPTSEYSYYGSLGNGSLDFTNLSEDRTYTMPDLNGTVALNEYITDKVATTKIVAASNSIDTTRADYVCDGTADQTEINLAMTALATTGGKIILLEGTYNLTGAIIFSASGITLEGMGYNTLLTTTSSSINMIENPSASWHSYCKVKNLRVYGGGVGKSNNGIFWYRGRYGEVEGCYLTGCAGIGLYLRDSEGMRVTNNHIEANVGTYTVYIYNDVNKIISNNFFKGNTGQYCIYAACTDSLISNNTINHVASNGRGIYIAGNNMSVIGNVVVGNRFNDTYGIYASANYKTIIGNTLNNHDYGIYDTGGSGAIIGNSFRDMTLGTIFKGGLVCEVSGNEGATSIVINEVVSMKNTSGGTILAGSVVVLKDVAIGDEITTTTTAGDRKVFGVATANIGDTAYGNILVRGKITTLKVDGTEDIAIGSFLSTFTTAGIAKKAINGDMAFAIALEAYTNNDSSGVLDALIIEPRGYLNTAEDLIMEANISVDADDKSVLLGEGQDMSVYYNGVDGNIDTDLVAPSDLVIDCGTDKTLVLEESVWDDLRITTAGFDRAGIADPSLVSYTPTGSSIATYLYEFQKDDIAYFTTQIPHTYKQGTDISSHIHWNPGLNGVGQSGLYVGWKVDYTWANPGSPFGSMGTVDLSDICDGINDKHQRTPDVTISGTSMAISAMLICNVKRTDLGDDDTWSGTASGQLPMILEIDFHYQIDTMGSRQLSEK